MASWLNASHILCPQTPASDDACLILTFHADLRTDWKICREFRFMIGPNDPLIVQVEAVRNHRLASRMASFN